MATFQSQINILAAGQHQLHKKIEKIEDFSLFVKYDSLETIIMDNEGKDSITISDLGYQAFNCILTVEETVSTPNNESLGIHFMDYKGLCDDFIIKGKKNSITTATNITIANSSPSSGTLSGNTLSLTSDIFINITTDNIKPKIINLDSQLTTTVTAPITEGTTPK